MKSQSSIRIIGGKWRSRKVSFLPADGLRPTPDRVRETLFNWLAPHIVGAKCLDLFAGSGVLGLEALSRGADSVVMIEKNPANCANISENLTVLQANNLQLVNKDAIKWLESAEPSPQFDIIFVDPPYAAGLLEATLKLLIENNCVSNNGLIYCEQPRALESSQIPPNLSVWRSARAGNVHYFLLKLEA